MQKPTPPRELRREAPRTFLGVGSSVMFDFNVTITGTLLLNAKILILDLLEGAVRLYGIDRIIEELDQIFVALPDGDAGAAWGGVLRTHELPILALVGLQESFIHGDRIREQQIDTPGHSIEVRFFLRRIQLELDDIAELRLDKVGVGGRALDAHRLALEAGLVNLDARALLARELWPAYSRKA